MATASGTPEAREPLTTRTNVRLVEYDKYIEGQLRKTRRQVRAVDLTSAILILVAGLLGYLLVATLIDHWLVSGGLGYAGRTIIWAVCLTGAVTWIGYVLLPLVFRRINPVYAAHAIEESRPTLKNSLVNLLLLRERGEKVSPQVMAAIEQQAATSLSQVTIEHAVDRSKLVILAWVLLGVVALCAIYKVASPKDPLRSFERMIAPWADIPPPTRVAITSIAPGSTKAFREQYVTVTATVSGLRSSEDVTLFYSTVDGQVVDKPVPMSGDGFTFTGKVPPTAEGLQQDIEYWVTAGDAKSDRYYVRMLETPSIVVDRITYDYPAYTEQSDRSVERQGDLSALEGTRVTIEATANDTIQSAYIDYECDGTRDLPMQVQDRKASITIPLQLRKGTTEPEYNSYQLRFVNTDGEENPKPIRYKIDVTPDLAPEVSFTKPEVSESTEITIAPSEVVKMTISANDPDYKLSGVTLFAERLGQKLLDRPLLAAPQSGTFNGQFLFDAKALKLSAGDTVTYWAEAVDNKQPEPNRVETPHYVLRIAASKAQQPPQARDGQKGGTAQPSQQNADQRRPLEGEDDAKHDRQDKPAEKDADREGTKRNGPQDDQTPRDPKNQRAGDNAAAEKQPNPDQRDDAQRKQDDVDPQRNAQGDQENQQPAQDEKGRGEQNQKQQKRVQDPREEKRVDPDAEKGKAFDEILKRMHEEEKARQPNKPDQDVPRADQTNQQNNPQNQGAEKQPPKKQEPKQRQEEQKKNPANQQPEDQKNPPQGNQDQLNQGQKGQGQEQDKQENQSQGGGQQGSEGQQGGQPQQGNQKGQGSQNQGNQDQGNQGQGNQGQGNQGNQEGQGQGGNQKGSQKNRDQQGGQQGKGEQGEAGQGQGEQGQGAQGQGDQQQGKPDKNQRGKSGQGNQQQSNQDQQGNQGQGNQGQAKNQNQQNEGQQNGADQPNQQGGNQQQGNQPSGGKKQPGAQQQGSPSQPGDEKPGDDAADAQQNGGQGDKNQQGQKSKNKSGSAQGQSDSDVNGQDQQGAGDEGEKGKGKPNQKGAGKNPDGAQGQKQPNQQPGAGGGPQDQDQNQADKSGSGSGDTKGKAPQQGGKEKGAGEKGAQNDPQGAGEDQQKNPAGKQNSSGNQNQKGKPTSTNKQNQTGQPDESGQQAKSQSPAGQEKQNRAREAQQSEPQQPGEGQTRSKQGQGDSTRGQEDKQQKQQNNNEKQQDQQGGSGDNNTQGDAGGGHGSDDKKGPGSPMEDKANQPRDKTPGKGEQQDKSSEQNPDSPSQSQRQSDSSKGQKGDQSGGGGQGGGQRSNSPGTGSAGQNTASDEGGGKADQQGSGETSNQGGNQKQGDGGAKGGSSSGQKGEGSHQQPGGDKQGGASGQQGESQKPGGQQSSNNPSQGNQGGEQQSGGVAPRDSGTGQRNNTTPGVGRPTGGGGLAGGEPEEPTGPPAERPETPEDDPNLEYTKKATDLAIEYLKDQLAKDKPDQKLLDELKWTRDDMRRFVDQWDRFKKQADSADPTAKKKAEEKMKSLGLRPRGTTLKGGQTHEGQSPTVRESRRSEPPPEYADQYRAYTTGAAKGARPDGK